MSSMYDVKKSVSVPESFSDTNCKNITDNTYYEEAWDIRMARLGIDLAKLNAIFNESISSSSDDIDCDTMSQSCANPFDLQDAPIIRMTSSAIESSAMANNPVYSFKKYDKSPKSLTSSPSKGNKLICVESNDFIFNESRADSEKTLDEHICNLTSLRPMVHRGLLLNNNCYELAPSQLVNAIIDKDREYPNKRLFSGTAQSAFKPLAISKPNQNQTVFYNNNCYTSVPSTNHNVPLKINFGYNRQVSAPVDSTTERIKKLSYPEDLELTPKTLQFKTSRRSMKKAHECMNSTNTLQFTNSWTLKARPQVDRHLHESSRLSSKLMSKSMIADDSRSSDNYIKHLTGQEIAGNFIKQSQRPECHIQRTEDRYHMGFNDSRLDMIADSNRPLEEHLWYHPFLSRVAAEQLLAKYPEGSFLVRRSESSTNEYSLSIRYKQKWLHMKISRDIDGQFVLGQYSQPYPSIPIMIRHYSCSFLPVKGANLISLQQPVFRL